MTAGTAEASTTTAEPLPLGRLDRATIQGLLASGRRLLVQGGMGIHASDGLSGKVARHLGAGGGGHGPRQWPWP